MGGDRRVASNPPGRKGHAEQADSLTTSWLALDLHNCLIGFWYEAGSLHATLQPTPHQLTDTHGGIPVQLLVGQQLQLVQTGLS